MEFLQVSSLSEEEVRSRIRVAGEENLRRARERGKGVFLLSAHIGGWELGAIRAGMLGEPIAPVVRPLDNPLLERELARRRTRFGNRLIAKREAAKDILRAMAKGETVAILVDQNVLAREAVFVPFFGRLAATTPALALLQLKTDAAVVPVFTWPEGGGRYRLEFETPILASEFEGLPRGEAVRRATARYMEVTEAAVRKAPEIWLWMHNRWRTRPASQEAGGGTGRRRPERVKRLVIGPNWLGDAVMSLPFLRAIRAAHPGDGLAVLAPRGPAAIYRAEGSADAVIERSPSLRQDASRLRGERFDEAWLLPNSFRAALIAWLGGARWRIGYATDRRAPLLTHALPPPDGTRHQLRDYDALLQARGIEPDLGPPRLPVPVEALALADRAIAAAGWPAGTRPILFSPGSAKAKIKRWPPERFAALADAVAVRGLPCGLLAGPDEIELGARVSAAARAPLPVLGPDLDPVALAALLARARLLVSNDSGPMHLAAAVGTPVAAFFGPTDPGRTAAVGPAVRVLDRYLFCSPCHLYVCPYGHECMEEITVEDALRACGDLLGGKGP